MSKYINELRRIQQEYFDLLVGFDPDADEETYYYRAIALIDKCELFWMSKRLEIQEILYDLTSNEKCVLLCGSLSLELDSGSQFELGAIGDWQIINDPVVGAKALFHVKGKASPSLRELFSYAISDTISVLRDYSDSFIVISVDTLMIPDAENNQKLAEKVYWDYISEALSCEMHSLKELNMRFASIEQLETALGESSKNFVFDESLNSEPLLETRVKKWFDTNSQIEKLSFSNEIDQFFIASFSQIQQALEILLKCLRFNLLPFIRYPVTLHYFTKIASGTPEDLSLSNLIEYAIISYLFANYVAPDQHDLIDFSEYQKLCKEQSLGEQFKNTVFSNGVSYSNVKISEACDIMIDLFQKEVLVFRCPINWTFFAHRWEGCQRQQVHSNRSQKVCTSNDRPLEQN